MGLRGGKRGGWRWSFPTALQNSSNVSHSPAPGSSQAQPSGLACHLKTLASWLGFSGLGNKLLPPAHTPRAPLFPGSPSASDPKGPLSHRSPLSPALGHQVPMSLQLEWHALFSGPITAASGHSSRSLAFSVCPVLSLPASSRCP